MKKIALVSIIDDDKIFQFATKKIIESFGLVEKIIQFPDGEKAIDYFVTNKDDETQIPDLVFLDLNMPYMDGWQFLDEFVTTKFKKELITVYISTSSNSVSDLKKSETYPLLKGFLIKPMTKADFEKVLRDELDLH